MEGQITITSHKDAGVIVTASLTPNTDMDAYYLKDIISRLFENQNIKKEAND